MSSSYNTPYSNTETSLAMSTPPLQYGAALSGLAISAPKAQTETFINSGLLGLQVIRGSTAAISNYKTHFIA